MSLDQVKSFERSLQQIQTNISTLERQLRDLRVMLDRTESQFEEFRNALAHNRSYQEDKQTSLGLYSTSQEKDKVSLIGKLPSALLSMNYFPNNEALVKFSEESLGITMPKGHRSRKEIIGIIVIEVAKLNPQKITQFINVLDRVLKRKPEGEKSFFEEWDKVIREMQFR